MSKTTELQRFKLGIKNAEFYADSIPLKKFKKKKNCRRNYFAHSYTSTALFSHYF
jgi:hypothetical protein